MYLSVYLVTISETGSESNIRLVKFQTWVKLPNIVKLADTY